jgi:hypothetical protein
MAVFVGSGTLNPGQSVEWWYTWGGYNGAQVARVMSQGIQGGKLCVHGHCVYRDYIHELDDTHYYYVTVTNMGPNTSGYVLYTGAV